MYKVCRNSFGVFPGLHRLVTTACTSPEGEGRGSYVNKGRSRVAQVRCNDQKHEEETSMALN